jgi:hypothetical protein
LRRDPAAHVQGTRAVYFDCQHGAGIDLEVESILEVLANCVRAQAADFEITVRFDRLHRYVSEPRTRTAGCDL